MRRLVILLVTLVFVPTKLWANDGAAEVGAGGIELRRERRVAMKREKLFISPSRVAVDYDFLNESSDDVVTEVAFPVPETRWCIACWVRLFEGFKAWVDEKPIEIAVDARAMLDGKDVTETLRAAGLDISGFGKVDESQAGRGKSQIELLSRQKLVELRALGLIADDAPYPKWSVNVTYHWNQRFPAGRVIHIRHEYKPAVGSQLHIEPRYLDDACADAATRKAVPKDVTLTRAEWVKYILTTANTWKTPIGEFELVVEAPKGALASFCWHGKVNQHANGVLRSSVKNFVPKNDFTIYFFSIAPTESHKSGTR